MSLITGILIGRIWSDALILRSHGVAVAFVLLNSYSWKWKFEKTQSTSLSPPPPHRRTVRWAYCLRRAHFHFHCRLYSHRTKWDPRHRAHKSRKSACTRPDHRVWVDIYSKKSLVPLFNSHTLVQSRPWAYNGMGWRKSSAVDSQTPIYTGQSVQYGLLQWFVNVIILLCDWYV